MKLFVFGLGYTAARFIELYGSRFDEVAGTVRSDKKRKLLRNCGADILLFDGTTNNPELAARAAESDRLLVSIPPTALGDPVLIAFPSLFATTQPGRVVYLSTVGVYANHFGSWIDETAPLIQSSDRRSARIQAEQAWQTLANERLRILRLAGIYGPERNALQRLRDQTARRIIKPDQVTNRIHVDDAAHAIAAAFAHRSSGVWNVCDDEPAPPQDVITFAAELAGLTPPPEEDFSRAEMTAMARSFYATNNRIRNDRLKSDLGVTLAYPTYRSGIAALK